MPKFECTKRLTQEYTIDLEAKDEDEALEKFSRLSIEDMSECGRDTDIEIIEIE